MRLRAFCAGMTLLGLLGSDVVASTVDDGKREADIKVAEAFELSVTCESNFPFLSLSWGNGDYERAAETASTFLDVPSVTPRMIIDKARECFSALKSEPGMFAVYFNQVELRCGVGPDIGWGRIVVGHVN
jgi:hypothetical protein